MEEETISKNGRSSKILMGRVVLFFALVNTVLIMTGCGRDNPLDNPNNPNILKTFTYTALAEGGGTISPSGLVSIKEGESRTFTASPNTGRTVNEWRENGSVVATSSNSYTVTNVQANGTIQVTFREQGYAPESLPRAYIFEAINPPTGFAGADNVFYWILNTTHGYHWQSIQWSSGIVGVGTATRLSSPYTYRKTSPNTATFNIARLSLPNGSSNAYYTGTLTYTSATECEYVYELESSGTVVRNIKVKFKVYVDPTKVYLGN